MDNTNDNVYKCPGFIEVKIKGADWVSETLVIKNEAIDSFDFNENFLSDSEKIKLGKIKLDKNKIQFISSRKSAKLILQKLVSDFKFKDWEIQNGYIGQPILHHVGNKYSYGVSLSHSNEYSGAMVFSLSHPCGIDIESTSRKINLAFINKYLNSVEKSLINRIDNIQGLIIWTAKEAISKVFMLGIPHSFNILEIKSIIECEAGVWEVKFKNFNPYKVISIVKKTVIFSLAIPEMGKLEKLS